MKNILTFSILIIGLALSSCKKEHKVTIQAKDVITGDGSAYAGMSFVVIQGRPGWYEKKYKRVYEGELDANGHASFLLKMQKNWSYILNISQPDNICYGGVLKDYLDNESSNHVVVDYLKCGYLNLPKVNVNCEGEEDKFWFMFYYTDNPDIYIYKPYLDINYNENEIHFFKGCIDYSSAQSYDKRPVGNYTIKWKVERSSGITTGTDTFNVTENDSTTYLIEY